MTVYPKVRARYSKGALKLLEPLRLPEGIEVRLRVTAPAGPPRKRKPARRRNRYPTRILPLRNLRRLSGIVALGGDALAESEAQYDHLRERQP